MQQDAAHGDTLPPRRVLLLTVHLRGAMTAGEIAGRFRARQGRNRVYVVDHSRLALVKDWLAWFDQNARERLP